MKKCGKTMATILLLWKQFFLIVVISIFGPVLQKFLQVKELITTNICFSLLIFQMIKQQSHTIPLKGLFTFFG